MSWGWMSKFNHLNVKQGVIQSANVLWFMFLQSIIASKELTFLWLSRHVRHVPASQSLWHGWAEMKKDKFAGRHDPLSHRALLMWEDKPQPSSIKEIDFLHPKPWILGDEKLIFTVVIHQWRSPLHQSLRARTINADDVTMLVLHVRMTPQINCGEKTVLGDNGAMSDR